MEQTSNKLNWKRILTCLLVVLLVLTADQYFKFWVKTNMRLGENIHVAGNWFILHFTENNGMAFGLEFAGVWGKLFLTFFRLLAVGGIVYYLLLQIRKGVSLGLTILISLILAGALGNIIDSVFYGRWFTESRYMEIATWAPGHGYSDYFKGKVVDMLYFPVIEGTYPSWLPVVGGKELIFFRPVFNIADASISIGVISILLFGRDLFKTEENKDEEEAIEDSTEDDTTNSESAELKEE